MNFNFHDLLQKEVSRKEFLRYIGVALLSVFGISSLLKALEQPQKTKQKVHGYGASSYGR